MNKYLVLAGTLVTAVGLTTFYLKGSQNATLNRPLFEHLDKRNLKTAYNAMFRDILSGKINIDDMTETQLDAMLLERYDQMGFN